MDALAVDLSTWNSFWTLERTRTTGLKPTLKETLTEFNWGYGISVVLAVGFLTMGALAEQDRRRTAGWQCRICLRHCGALRRIDRGLSALSWGLRLQRHVQHLHHSARRLRTKLGPRLGGRHRHSSQHRQASMGRGACGGRRTWHRVGLPRSIESAGGPCHHVVFPRGSRDCMVEPPSCHFGKDACRRAAAEMAPSVGLARLGLPHGIWRRVRLDQLSPETAHLFLNPLYEVQHLVPI